MFDQQYYITELRKYLRNYLETDISANYLTLPQAQVLAKEIDDQITHTITDQNQLKQISQNLINKYPELKPAFEQAYFNISLDIKRNLVDTEIMSLIDQGLLDQALSKLLTLKK